MVRCFKGLEPEDYSHRGLSRAVGSSSCVGPFPHTKCSKLFCNCVGTKTNKVQAGSQSLFLLILKEMKALSRALRPHKPWALCSRPHRGAGPAEGHGSPQTAVWAPSWIHFSLCLKLPVPTRLLERSQEKRLPRLSLQPQSSLAHSTCSVNNC